MISYVSQFPSGATNVLEKDHLYAPATSHHLLNNNDDGAALQPIQVLSSALLAVDIFEIVSVFLRPSAIDTGSHENKIAIRKVFVLLNH